MDAKEDAYISLLKKIVTNIAEPIDVVFDAFNKKDFEKKIILSILPMDNIEKIAPGDSVLEPGLQFVDNICGAIRLSKSNKDEWGFFDIIATIELVPLYSKTTMVTPSYNQNLTQAGLRLPVQYI